MKTVFHHLGSLLMQCAKKIGCGVVSSHRPRHLVIKCGQNRQ
jgi:hypothetical protein